VCVQRADTSPAELSERKPRCARCDAWVEGKAPGGGGVAGQLAAGANAAGTVLYDTLPAILGRAATSDEMDRAAELFFGCRTSFRRALRRPLE
jgi:hypothetical protein